jgi:hypothetical protein
LLHTTGPLPAQRPCFFAFFGHLLRNLQFCRLKMGLGAAAGFALNQLALTAAGEIIPEGRTNARMANKPEFPVSLD